MQWDPTQYARYANERSRPFFDLVGQVFAETPEQVADLGCGPGELTASLAQRWPAAQVLGVDSSPQMIERAQQHVSDSVKFSLGNAEEFDASGLDVLISNALLQWVPTHRQLMLRWLDELNPGGWLAFQVPSNFSSPSHQLMRQVASSPRWGDLVGTVLRHDDAVAEPADYLDLLADPSRHVSVWQTEYLHVLNGDDPVLQWVKGTGLRPILDALGDDQAAEFEAEYAALLRQAYPPRPYGTVFAFLRTFVCVHKR
ncbi:methyltransferase domain-containing protein [Jatrophihabitans sp. DSM 45814]